ncbi:MAG: hypothetical protein Q7S23_04365 [bacterium]|nr:hypothetical protein [bacterium]
MNWTAYLVTAVFGAYLPMFISWREGTLLRMSCRPMLRLTFFHHWGVCVGDAVLLPFLNGIIWDHLNWKPWYQVAVIATIATLLTWLCHRQWWPTPQCLVFGIHFPNRWQSRGNAKRWSRDLSAAGRLHIAFMAAQLTILATYVLSPAPASVVWVTAALLAVFPLVAVFQTSWVVHHRLDANALLTATAIWCATGGVTAVKLLA